MEVWSNLLSSYFVLLLNNGLYLCVLLRVCWGFFFLGNYDVTSIMNKWKYLRDKYAREKKSYKRPSGSGSTPLKVWEHFEELKFLEDIVAVEPT